MIKKICPCLRWWQKSRQKKGGIQEDYEEQQFMEQLEQEAKQSQFYSYETTGQKISVQQQLQRQLNPTLNTNNTNKIFEQIQTQQVELPKQEQTEDLLEIQQIPEFKINIDKASEYYQILSDATQDIQKVMNKNVDCTQLFLSHDKLSINKMNFRIWRKKNQAQKERKYLVTYQLPCSYAFYNDMMNRTCHIEEKNKFISENRFIESLFPNLSSKFIWFGNVSLFGMRAFSYLKYTNAIQNNHWEVCLSRDDLECNINEKTKKSKVRSISLLTQNENDGAVSLKVQTYFELTDDIIFDRVWEKVYAQYRNYLNEVWQQASTNYEEEIL